jgi:prepilin-type N-terminal cleavage/methylation domain-containing protein
MATLRRRGFTVPELLVAVVIFGIVSTAIYGLLVRTQRLSRTQAERSMMQANIRTGMALVTSELRELNANATQADIYALSATAIEYKGMRGLGFVCDVVTGSITVPRGDLWNGFRNPQAGRDRVMVFVDNDPDTAADDAWTERASQSINSTTCILNGVTLPGWRLNLNPNLSADTVAMISEGSPVRTFERMEIARMDFTGESWLGARSVSGGEALTQILGPLTAAGVTFSGWTEAAGTSTETTTPANIRTIRLTLRGLTQNIVAAGAGTVAWQRASDTLMTDIRLRNAP